MTEQEISEYLDDNRPQWIEEGYFTELEDLRSVTYGGCASGSYMPAVTYHQALTTMADSGNDVLQYIQDNYGEVPMPSQDESWAGMAVHFLSMAVELWCSEMEVELS